MKVRTLLKNLLSCSAKSHAKRNRHHFRVEALEERRLLTAVAGYTLIAPMASTDTYLVDNDGSTVHTWESDYKPGLSTYLLEDGSLMRTASVLGSNTAGGAGGRVEQFNWDGELIWEFETDSDHRTHHDVEVLPNGNVLMIAWETIGQDDAIAAGRDPSMLSDGELWPDHIIEVEPTGTSGGNIVWEWHAWDHLVQDYDPAQANYGVVGDHPELIDANFDAGQGRADWTHINSIDYNTELDQILLSVRNFSEIWVIDHSTTTAEAAGHTGGNRGSGGDILYRWGNSQVYDAGTPAEQQLFNQHDAEWIADGLPGEDAILVFNNGTNRGYSSVDEIVTPVGADGHYTLAAGQDFGPNDLAWSYIADTPTDFYADHISGSQRLAGGNTLITDGIDGLVFEVSSAGETVWQYDVGGQVFRADKYSPDFAGFDGTELDDDVVGTEQTFSIVDTGQTDSYDAVGNVIDPQAGEAFFGQDAQHDGNQASYTFGGSGLSVDDNVTGLTWTQTPDWNGDGDIDTNDKFTFAEAQNYVDTLNAQNYDGNSDWRLPSIKELYSLIDFSGITGMTEATSTPYINTDYFAFDFGDEASGERIIDAQYWSSTEYVSTTMGGSHTVFGVNFADGRIKGYGTSNPSGAEMSQYVRFVRGNTDYGVNDLVDNGDSTVTDNATGLTWAQDDSVSGMDWEAALSWVQEMNDANYLGHNDWRLPNAKELQSIVDYSRSPDTTGSAAIDPLFNVSTITDDGGDTDFPFFWTSTTHLDGPPEQLGNYAVYVAFGEAEGWMQPPTGGDYVLQDVHGAGAQRSDPKSGESDDYPNGHGPQGDVVRINNYVRLVRDADDNGGDGEEEDPNVAPTAEAGGPFEAVAGSSITLDASASTDADGTIVQYRWDLDNDGQYDDATGVTASFTSETAGSYTVGLQVTDDDGAQSVDATELNFAPAPETNHAPELAHPIRDQTARANSRFRFQLPPDTFVDPDADQSLSYTATNTDGTPLPEWMRFNRQSQTFSGRPSFRNSGQYDVLVTATDSGSPELAASAVFTLNVIGRGQHFVNQPTRPTPFASPIEVDEEVAPEAPARQTPVAEASRRQETPVDEVFKQGSELSSPSDWDDLMELLANDIGNGRRRV